MILFLIKDDIVEDLRNARTIFRKKLGKFPTHIGIRKEIISDGLTGVILVTMSPPKAPPPHHFFLWREDDE